METLGAIIRGLVEGGTVRCFETPASVLALRRALNPALKAGTLPRPQRMEPEVAWLASWLAQLGGMRGMRGPVV